MTPTVMVFLFLSFNTLFFSFFKQFLTLLCKLYNFRLCPMKSGTVLSAVRSLSSCEWGLVSLIFQGFYCTNISSKSYYNGLVVVLNIYNND